MPHYPKETEYSEKYKDDYYEYRHVFLTKAQYRQMKEMGKTLLSEDEWRQLGIQQSRGWVHYTVYQPEPQILLFRRCILTDPATGKIMGELTEKMLKYEKEKKENLDIDFA